MALSSQGGLDFRAQRYDDPTQSLQNAFGAGSIFSKTLDRMDAQQSENEKMRMLKEQQEIDRRNDALKMNMLIDSANREKSKFDTEQNTLRATSEAVPEMDKRATGQALLNDQAAKLIDPLNARTTALAAKSGMTKEQFEQSDLMTKAVQAGAFADLTGVGATDPKKQGGSIGASGQAMLDANAKDMNVQKRLLSEFTPSFLKPDSDEAMLYDSSKINDYRQNLLQGLDRRIHEKDVLDQNAAQFDKNYKLQVANAKRQEEHMRKAERAADEAKREEAARLEAFGKSLIPAEKQTHKVYTKEFGEKILKPLKKLEEIKTRRETEAILDFSKDPVFKRSGLSVVNVNGKPTIVNPGGRPVSDYYVSEQQKKLDNAVFKKVAPDTGDGTLYTRIANLKKVATDADNPVYQKTYGYKFTGKKVGSDNLANLVTMPGGNYKSNKPDYIKDPNAYSALMRRMAIDGIDQFGNPASTDDITMARLWLLKEQESNVEASRDLGRANVNTVNTDLKPPKPSHSDN